MLMLSSFLTVLAQNGKNTDNKKSPDDSLKNLAIDTSEYEIVYEIDTIYQTKHITEYDTIYQYEAKKAEPVKSILAGSDSIIKIPDSICRNEKYFSAALRFSAFTFNNNFAGSEASYSTYIDYRKSSEASQTSFSLALLPRYSFNKWNIQSGVQYSLLKNKYDYPYHTEKLRDSVSWQYNSYNAWINDTVDVYYIITPGNDSIPAYIIYPYWGTVHDSSSTTKTDTIRENLTKSGNQYYHLLEIPVIFGYRALQWKKLKIDVNAGIIASLLVYRKGEIISYQPENSFMNLQYYPLCKATFSAYMGLSISFALNKKVEAEVTPYYIYGLTSALKKSSPVSQTQNRKGISVGVAYRF